ncbi:hypothetical protein QM201_07785 [Enterobacter asburiae]|nr:hypothetical protein [Enterobacter asburiae]
MDNALRNLSTFIELDASEKLGFLRSFNQALDLSSAIMLLDIATDIDSEDEIRIEAVKILGLYHGEYNDAFIKEALVQIIRNDAVEDDSLIVNCINSLALLSVRENEIAFALSLINGALIICLNMPCSLLFARINSSLRLVKH